MAELMGHRAGWLTLGAGLAGGADVILLPEIPYRVEAIVEAIWRRTRSGKNFSIVAVAEGARNEEDAAAYHAVERRLADAPTPADKEAARADLAALDARHAGNTLQLAHQLEEPTGLESRLTILGYVQRGGTPSAVERLLATRLGMAGADLVADGHFGVAMGRALRELSSAPAARQMAEVASKRRTIPPDPWIATVKKVGTCLGD